MVPRGPDFPELSHQINKFAIRGVELQYHKASHHLTVHSGHVTDTLTLLAPQSTHFAAASDHHGGTDVFLIFA